MVSLETILFYVILSSLLGLSGGLILLANRRLAQELTRYFVGFAAGALLATSFLDLLPEALSLGKNEFVLGYTLIGILSFFFIEESLIWHHHHTHEKEEVHFYTPLIIFGDTIHNLIDGIIIATTFAISPALGISTFLSIVFHEVPQEISDFGLLLHGKMQTKKIIFFNVLSAFASVLGAVVSYFFLFEIEAFAPALVAFAAGAFIYIALSDLIPENRKEKDIRRSLLQVALLVFGILVIFGAGLI
ncbi:MAG: ZIP family metal transporter [Nitrosopumilus sp.]